MADFCHLISWGINWMWRRGRRSGQRRRESEMNTWGTDRSIHKCTIINSLPPFESLKVQLINGSACHSRFLSISPVPAAASRCANRSSCRRRPDRKVGNKTHHQANGRLLPVTYCYKKSLDGDKKKTPRCGMKAEKPLLRMLYFFPLIWCARCVEAKAVLFARNELQLQLIFKNR